MGNRVHNWLLYAVAATIPMAVTLGKMLWRFFSRVPARGLRNRGDQGGYAALRTAGLWASQQSAEGRQQYSMAAGLSLFHAF